jgi:hypothetical protein
LILYGQYTTGPKGKPRACYVIAALTYMITAGTARENAAFRKLPVLSLDLNGFTYRDIRSRITTP